MRKLLQKIITLFTFLLFFLFLLDLGFSDDIECNEGNSLCEKYCGGLSGNNKDKCIDALNDAFDDRQETQANEDSTSEDSTSSSSSRSSFDWSSSEEEIEAYANCLYSDSCYYDEDTNGFKFNEFGFDRNATAAEVNARVELDNVIDRYCTPGKPGYSREACNRNISNIQNLDGTHGGFFNDSDQDRAESYLVGERWGWFWYLFQGEDAAATFTLNKYGVDWGVSEEQLEWASEPIISKVCINNNDLELEDLGVSFENEIDDIVEGESLFDFRGSITNLIPIDEDLIEGEGYVKYSYYFKKPEKSAIGDFDDEELQKLSKRNIAVVLFYNKMNRSDDDPDDIDFYGYYEVISDPDVIELNSENPIISSGIELVYADEVYLPDPNFRIAFYYRDYFEVEGGEKKQENLRIWTSSSSLPNAMVIPEQIKSLENTTSSSTDNSINKEGQTSSGSGSSNEIEDDFLSGLS